MKNTKPAPSAKNTLDFGRDIVAGVFNNTNFGYELVYFLVSPDAKPLPRRAVLSGRDVMDAIDRAAHEHDLAQAFSKELKAARALLTATDCQVVVA